MAEEEKKGYFSYLPVSLFGVVMAFAGLTGAWKLTETSNGWSHMVSTIVGYIAITVFVLQGGAYIVKALTAWEAVKNEWKHPISSNFFATIPMTLLLIPTVLLGYIPNLAYTLWTVGAVLMVWFSWYMVSRWLSVRQEMAHVTPAWILPVVGIINVPVFSNITHTPAYNDIAIATIAIGLFFAIPLVTMIMSRLILHEPLPDGMRPTLMILLAPFAVGYNSYVSTFGSDTFSHIIFSLAVFFFAVLIKKIAYFRETCAFRMAWWGISFPLAAFASASVRFSLDYPGTFMGSIALIVLVFVTLVLGLFLLRSLRGIINGDLQKLI